MIKFGTIVVPANTTIQDEFIEGSDRVLTLDGQSPFLRSSPPVAPSLNPVSHVYKKRATSDDINTPENKALPAKKKSVVRKSHKTSQYLKDTFEGE